jgi:hypothetical protein
VNKTLQRTVLKQVKEAIRRPFAWPGGYPVYTVLSDGSMLCRTCARSEYRQIARATLADLRDGWCAVGTVIHWEGAESCAHCDKDLESAYGSET